ncbi:hypothetical protein CDCA_CDCA09G2681 [Cyanidium caldarium]|uniref:Protein kinase domain-containing protein n=1 Tax=Cyanidium caldarium TaxID=2771 RepID=A0AAV9IX13_CYACA|nr:hypothetical protein CDCA_CDCA09G2681 [Cyanidium caldarium]
MLDWGSTKRVYAGIDTVDATEVAWNDVVIHAPSGAEEELKSAKECSWREMAALRKVQHLHIVHLYDAWEVRDEHGQLRGSTLITERFCSGNLKTYIEQLDTLKLRVIRRWGYELLQALRALHSQTPPLVHRNVKVENLFVVVGQTGSVKLGDLGMVLEQHHAGGRHCHVVGLPALAAPEMCYERCTIKSDVYSFGMLMLELIVGRVPYASCGDVLRLDEQGRQVELLEALDCLHDSDFMRVILQCLRVEPERPTAAELLLLPLFADWASDLGMRENVDLRRTGEEEERARAIRRGRDDTLRRLWAAGGRILGRRLENEEEVDVSQTLDAIRPMEEYRRALTISPAGASPLSASRLTDIVANLRHTPRSSDLFLKCVWLDTLMLFILIVTWGRRVHRCGRRLWLVPQQTTPKLEHSASGRQRRWCCSERCIGAFLLIRVAAVLVSAAMQRM